VFLYSEDHLYPDFGSSRLFRFLRYFGIRSADPQYTGAHSTDRFSESTGNLREGSLYSGDRDVLKNMLGRVNESVIPRLIKNAEVIYYLLFEY
jgi:hypothetical protein